MRAATQISKRYNAEYDDANDYDGTSCTVGRAKVILLMSNKAYEKFGGRTNEHSTSNPKARVNRVTHVYADFNARDDRKPANESQLRMACEGNPKEAYCLPETRSACHKF